MKEILNSTRNKDEFVKKMTASFVGIPGLDGLNTVADKHYQ